MNAQTYNYIQHPVSGETFIQRTGRRKAENVNNAAGKSSRDKWQLKTECELNSITDSIQWMSKNEMRKFKRKNKKAMQQNENKPSADDLCEDCNQAKKENGDCFCERMAWQEIERLNRYEQEQRDNYADSEGDEGKF